LENPNVKIPEKIEFINPNDDKDANFRNSKKLYEALSGVTPSQAADERLWAYMTHVEFWDYMRSVRPPEDIDASKRSKYIVQHWFVDGSTQKDLTRNDISTLWWGAYLTHDKEREDPYELTKELWSMKDYTRSLLGGIQGRQHDFTKGLLEFVIEHPDIFADYKEGKVRFLMREANYAGGYKNFRSLSRGDIKAFFAKYTNELENWDK
jgi:hypothetical protein